MRPLCGRTSRGLLGRHGEARRGAVEHEPSAADLIFSVLQPHFGFSARLDPVSGLSSNMSDNLDGKDDFDEQLRMQELYGDTKDGDIQKDPGGATGSFGQQPDDTPYEWDLDKKAWFPKVRVCHWCHCRAGPAGQPRGALLVRFLWEVLG